MGEKGVRGMLERTPLRGSVPLQAQCGLSPIWLVLTFEWLGQIQSSLIWSPDLCFRRVLWILGSQTLTRHHLIP